MASYTLQGFTNDASSPDLDATNLNEMDNAIKIGHDFADSASATPEAGKAMVWPDNSIKVWRSDNDGSGSGLDADTVDGLQPTGANNHYLAATKYGVTDLNNIAGNGIFFNSSETATNRPAVNGFVSGIQFYIADNPNYKVQMSVGVSSNSWFVRTSINGTWDSWQKLWNGGNDGSGSGLETDKIPFATKTGTSTGSQGQASFDASYLYLCTATNVWKRVALSSF